MEEVSESLHWSSSSRPIKGQRPQAPACELDVIKQRVLASVGDPYLLRTGLLDGPGKFAPIGVIGDHKRKLDAPLARAGADPHPTRGEGPSMRPAGISTSDPESPTAAQSTMAPLHLLSRRAVAAFNVPERDAAQRS